jgi:hypothetical protein
MFNIYDESVRNFYVRRRSQPPGTSHLGAAAGALFMILLLLGSAAAWVTHVIVCIKASAWILLLFGCFVAPVGVVHGFGVWLGVF